MRGEEGDDTTKAMDTLEIPPRARGRVLLTGGRMKRIGNTPACAGKSGWRCVLMICGRKYPRVRGEELLQFLRILKCMEIPPRARGRV